MVLFTWSPPTASGLSGIPVRARLSRICLRRNHCKDHFKSACIFECNISVAVMRRVHEKKDVKKRRETLTEISFQVSVVAILFHLGNALTLRPIRLY